MEPSGIAQVLTAFGRDVLGHALGGLLAAAVAHLPRRLYLRGQTRRRMQEGATADE